MPKKRSHPMPPLHESSQDYGGIEAGLSPRKTAVGIEQTFGAWSVHRSQSSTPHRFAGHGQMPGKRWGRVWFCRWTPPE